MNITSVKTGGFANGFNHFCMNCSKFFSAQFLDDELDEESEIIFCPNYGAGALISSVDDLLHYCSDKNTDPVNFYHAFPPEEPIPNSITGAMPRQVEWIMGCVISDKQKTSR